VLADTIDMAAALGRIEGEFGKTIEPRPPAPRRPRP
jgi:hypothetical protein